MAINEMNGKLKVHIPITSKHFGMRTPRESVA
eukprot:CCRYP_015247-RE/>CCRYP_015247-RE protein AED:0.49 eAED:0.49 QI:58/1/1/1/0/0/2/56/31